MSDDDQETVYLLRRAAAGDRRVLDELFSRHRERLLRMVRLRLDGRVKRRVGASDIIQEALSEAYQRLPEYLERPDMSFFNWLRFITGQKILTFHRRHLGAGMRDAGLEVHLGRPGVTSAAMSAHLMGEFTSPSHAAAQAETRVRLMEALESLGILDLEILAMRHYEQLTNGEAARELGLDKSTASKRYVRALKKLRRNLGPLDESGSPDPQ